MVDRTHPVFLLVLDARMAHVVAHLFEALHYKSQDRRFDLLTSGTQDRGFAPDRSRRIFRMGKFTACLPSEGEVK
jgi:uncharacterized protein (DUF1786 family)